MKLPRYLLFVFVILFISIPVFSQSGRPVIAKEPTWVTKNKVDYYRTALDKDAADGYIDISIEKQVSLVDNAAYSRRSIKIISQAGVQNGSQVSVSFNPAYQQLIFHNVSIIRKGETLNRLVLSGIKTVHQEKELRNFIYNGTLDALLILEDVRVADIIEYSYTIKGSNPIFKNKYSGSFNMQFSCPIYELYYKIIVPPGRKINIKSFNDNADPFVSTINGQQVYEWKRTGMAPLTLQDYTPSWYDPYPQFMVSEYDSWKEVNDWAMELFPVKKELSPKLQKKIKEIEKEYRTDSERAGAALQFVQDDIRYMGIEMGENSHRPADPSKVFAQRYGDCKEKSYLLCCMLRAMKIESDPVLINTENKKDIFNFLPAATDFDHVTVRVKLDSTYYWLDPTIACQRGKIKNLFYPDYQAGLVVTTGNTALTSIDFRNINYTRIREYFKVTSMTGSGTLLVTTLYQGNAADDIRSEFNNQSITELMMSYQKFYAVYYESIKADSLTYVDDDKTGVFTTKEYYTVPDFWMADKEHVSKFTFSNFAINSILTRPKEKDRKMPFSLSFPAKYQEEIIIDLPEAWNVTESELHLKNKCYAYNSRFYSINNQVYLKTNYESFKDHALVNETEDYFNDLNEYEKHSYFELSNGKDEAVNKKYSPLSTTNRNIVLSVLVIVFVIGVLIARRQQQR